MRAVAGGAGAHGVDDLACLDGEEGRHRRYFAARRTARGLSALRLDRASLASCWTAYYFLGEGKPAHERGGQHRRAEVWLLWPVHLLRDWLELVDVYPQEGDVVILLGE